MEHSLSEILWRLAAVMALVFANGFFVAAEFAIIAVRKTRIDQLVAEGHKRAPAVRRAVSDPDSYIAATQLGITMASLGLGWIGEPALASLVSPAVTFLPTGLAEATSHTISVAIAFAIVTALHITHSRHEAVQLADVMFRGGEYDAATFHFQQLLEQHPSHYQALERLLLLLRRAGRLPVAPKF
ncbi:MAG: CNNM domain-containing protein, partial [Vicinamibacterales bacterium]